MLILVSCVRPMHRVGTCVKRTHDHLSAGCYRTATCVFVLLLIHGICHSQVPLVWIWKGPSNFSTSMYRGSFAPDGNTFATGGVDGHVYIWNAKDGVLTRSLAGHSAPVYALAHAPDGTRLASGSWDHTIRIWDAINGEAVYQFLWHTDQVRALAYSPDGNFLASGSIDGAIAI